MGAAHGVCTKAGLNSRPASPPHVDSVSGSSTTSMAPYPYALLLGSMVAVDVYSFLYLRDEHGVSVSYVYRTWKKSTSQAREAWPAQW